MPGYTYGPDAPIQFGVAQYGMHPGMNPGMHPGMPPQPAMYYSHPSQQQQQQQQQPLRE